MYSKKNPYADFYSAKQRERQNQNESLPNRQIATTLHGVSTVPFRNLPLPNIPAPVLTDPRRARRAPTTSSTGTDADRSISNSDGASISAAPVMYPKQRTQLSVPFPGTTDEDRPSSDYSVLRTKRRKKGRAFANYNQNPTAENKAIYDKLTIEYNELVQAVESKAEYKTHTFGTYNHAAYEPEVNDMLILEYTKNQRRSASEDVSHNFSTANVPNRLPIQTAFHVKDDHRSITSYGEVFQPDPKQAEQSVSYISRSDQHTDDFYGDTFQSDLQCSGPAVKEAFHMDDDLDVEEYDSLLADASAVVASAPAFACLHCARSFELLDELIAHYHDDHNTKHCCDYCPHMFVSNKAANDHLTAVHGPGSYFICYFCDIDTIRTRGAFRDHVDECHSAQSRLLRCKKCDFLRPTYIALKLHEAASHPAFRSDVAAQAKKTLLADGAVKSDVAEEEEDKLFVADDEDVVQTELTLEDGELNAVKVEVLPEDTAATRRLQGFSEASTSVTNMPRTETRPPPQFGGIKAAEDESQPPPNKRRKQKQQMPIFGRHIPTLLGRKASTRRDRAVIDEIVSTKGIEASSGWYTPKERPVELQTVPQPKKKNSVLFKPNRSTDKQTASNQPISLLDLIASDPAEVQCRKAKPLMEAFTSTTSAEGDNDATDPPGMTFLRSRMGASIRCHHCSQSGFPNLDAYCLHAMQAHRAYYFCSQCGVCGTEEEVGDELGRTSGFADRCRHAGCVMAHYSDSLACPFCGENCYYGLLSHYKDRHPSARTHLQCSQCDSVLPSAAALDLHRDAAHDSKLDIPPHDGALLSAGLSWPKPIAAAERSASKHEGREEHDDHDDSNDDFTRELKEYADLKSASDCRKSESDSSKPVRTKRQDWNRKRKNRKKVQREKERSQLMNTSRSDRLNQSVELINEFVQVTPEDKATALSSLRTRMVRFLANGSPALVCERTRSDSTMQCYDQFDNCNIHAYYVHSVVEHNAPFLCNYCGACSTLEEVCSSLSPRPYQEDRYVLFECRQCYISDKNVTCAECGMAFARHPQLAKHMRSTHNVDDHQCFVCLLLLPNKHCLKLHEAFAHCSLDQQDAVEFRRMKFSRALTEASTGDAEDDDDEVSLETMSNDEQREGHGAPVAFKPMDRSDNNY